MTQRQVDVAITSPIFGQILRHHITTSTKASKTVDRKSGTMQALASKYCCIQGAKTSQGKKKSFTRVRGIFGLNNRNLVREVDLDYYFASWPCYEISSQVELLTYTEMGQSFRSVRILLLCESRPYLSMMSVIRLWGHRVER